MCSEPYNVHICKLRWLRTNHRLVAIGPVFFQVAKNYAQHLFCKFAEEALVLYIAKSRNKFASGVFCGVDDAVGADADEFG